jgi:membrane fusion protein, adhesin transport system
MASLTPYRHAWGLAPEETVRDLVAPPKASRVLARILFVLFWLVAAAMVLAPWQQSSRGEGRVIAYAPVERQQNVEAPVGGRVARWYVQEGEHVEEGAPIADIADNDPDIVSRIERERDAQIAKLEAAKAKREATASRADSLGGSRSAAIRAAESRALMAANRVRAAEQSLKAAEQDLLTAELNVKRQRALSDDGLASRRSRELAEQAYVKEQTDLERARVALSAARAEESAIIADMHKIENDTAASVSGALASRASAESDIASATAALAKIEVKLARQRSQSVRAPRAGTILRVVAKQGGEQVKSGDLLAVIVPDTRDRAVELWIDGNDVPLVTPGRHVRLQFEGWPAVQFTGWPEVAVGTFGGTVAFVDAADDGSGRFRAVIIPDASGPWPAARFLRQGTRVNGWVLLDRVRLGYEVWRQVNGFPPKRPTKQMYDDAPLGVKGKSGKGAAGKSSGDKDDDGKDDGDK